jgi:hypothetical protein
MRVGIGQLPVKPKCPACGEILDGYSTVTGPAESPPRPGDFTVCSRCLIPLEFTRSLGLRRVDIQHLAENDPEAAIAFQKSIRAAQEFNAFKRKQGNT